MEVFEVNRQLWQQELLGGMSGKAGKAGTGSHTSGMSCVSPKGAKEEVEHSMLVFPTGGKVPACLLTLKGARCQLSCVF